MGPSAAAESAPSGLASRGGSNLSRIVRPVRGIPLLGIIPVAGKPGWSIGSKIYYVQFSDVPDAPPTRAGSWIFISGQVGVPLPPDKGSVTFEQEVRTTFERIRDSLGKLGAGM